MDVLKSILNQLVGIEYSELSQAEKSILNILSSNGIEWHISQHGVVTGAPTNKENK